MKKIFTLLCAAALAVPMMSADEVNVSIYQRSGSAAGIKLGAYLGSMKNNISYDAATGVCSVTNFLGYTNGNIDFTLIADEKFTSTNGEERTPVCYNIPTGSIVIAANAAKTKWSFHTTDEEFDDDTNLEYIDVFDSGVFTGNDETDFAKFKLVDTSLWGVCDDSSAAAFDNVKVRSYAVPVNGGFQFVIEVQPIALKVAYDDNGAYTYGDDFDLDLDSLNFLAVFTVGGTSTGVSEITVDNEAAVEYFNLQGVRINNPTNGLYIMRQGSKTTKVSIR